MVESMLYQIVKLSSISVWTPPLVRFLQLVPIMLRACSREITIKEQYVKERTYQEKNLFCPLWI